MNYFIGLFTYISGNRNIQVLLLILCLIIIVKIVEIILINLKSKWFIKGKSNLISGTHFFLRFIIISIVLILLTIIDYLKIEKEILNIINKTFNSFIIFLLYLISKDAISLIFKSISSTVLLRKIAFLRNKNLFDLSYKFSHITLILITVTLIFGLWNVQIGPILTGLGIAGLAVGLAIQDSLSNIFGGISLILDDAFAEDDYVELPNGETGVIYSIGYRSTKIKTFSEEIIIVPNGKLAQMNIKNLSRPAKYYRLTLDISVEYGNNIDHIKDIIINVIKNIDGILDFPEPSVLITKIANLSIDFKLSVSIRSPFDKAQKTDRIYSDIYNKFIELGIKVPAPSK